MTLYSKDACSGHLSRGECSPLELARGVARILRKDASSVDREGKFPVRGMQALKQVGLMGCAGAHR